MSKHIITNLSTFITEKYNERKSTVTHNNNTYKVNDLIEKTKDNKVIYMSTKSLEWILKYSDIEDVNRIIDADLSYPIIVTKYRKNKYVVLDGLHRLAKALILKKTKIKTYVIDNDDLLEFDIS